MPITTSLLGAISFVIVAAAGGSDGKGARVKGDSKKILTVKLFDGFDVVHEQRVKFAADHGVANPAALASAVRDSPMANLLISVAIAESLGDPVALGSAGEQGAWQVKASDWGLVPKDIHGQASQAERIIRDLLVRTNGNRKNALACYNGGTTPPARSYRYAERILKRAGNLQVEVNYLPPKINRWQEALLNPPGRSRMLSSFFRT